MAARGPGIWTGSMCIRPFLDWKIFSSDANAVTVGVGRQELGFGSGQSRGPRD
jgi:hypothetical protein